MRILLLLSVALALCAPAKADKFWLEDPANAAKSAEGSTPLYLQGVLLGEADGFYEIRVEGGTLRLPKASVHRIDKDALTVAAIESAEQGQHEALASADNQRQQAQAARTVRRSVVAEAREASVSVDDVGAAPAFDPVLGVLRVDRDPLAELRLRFPEGRDRNERKVLRQLRRLR